MTHYNVVVVKKFQFYFVMSIVIIIDNSLVTVLGVECLISEKLTRLAHRIGCRVVKSSRGNNFRPSY